MDSPNLTSIQMLYCPYLNNSFSLLDHYPVALLKAAYVRSDLYGDAIFSPMFFSWFFFPSSLKIIYNAAHAIARVRSFFLQDMLTTNTGLFISLSGISELDCATTKRDTAERSISISRESLKVFFFVLGALAYLQVPPLGGSRDEKWRAQ